jgi:phosphoenolpyruvate synthase/pyruvate phosphate dikinase
MSVLVQEMVAARAAGVLYTTWEGNLLIEACEGLGEPLVSGSLSPWQYRLDRTSGAVISVLPGRQRVALAVTASGGMDHRMATRSNPLAPTDLVALQRVGQAVERTFGCPQDVEWAIDEKPHILQSRALPVK